MDGNVELLAPRARKNGLIVRELEDEVLVYDLERHRAHCLNRAAGLVWKHADGETSIPELAAILRKDLGLPATEQTVWHALLQLGDDHLLEERVSRVAAVPRITRRQMMAKVGLAVTAAAVTSIAVGGVAHAASCHPACTGNTTCVTCGDGSGTACCNNSPQCCSKTCCANNKPHCVAGACHS